LIFFAALLQVQVVIADTFSGQTSTTGWSKPQIYSPSWVCSDCHQYLYRQFEKSMHARAFITPVFQGQVYDVLLSQMRGEPKAMYKVGAYLACHSPAGA